MVGIFRLDRVLESANQDFGSPTFCNTKKKCAQIYTKLRPTSFEDNDSRNLKILLAEVL